MKRILLPLFFLLGHFCIAQPRHTGTNNNSLLWRISGNGLTKPSYLFGTMHLICSTDYLWTPIMAKSLDSSEAICLEMNIDDPAVMTKAATAMINMDGTTLSAYFTQEQLGKLAKYLKDSMDMDIALLMQVKPIGLETMLSMGTPTCKEPVSYEEKIIGTAHSNNKPVMGLEEVEEQVALLNSIPTDSIVHDILEIINGKTANTDEYSKMVALYTAQDLPALYLLIKDGKGDVGDMNAFLDERNKKWIGRMTPMMKKQSVFFASGAGHLWGDNGVISLLRKAGYTVNPIH